MFLGKKKDLNVQILKYNIEYIITNNFNFKSVNAIKNWNHNKKIKWILQREK